MKVRINAETLICKHVDKKANIQYIIERKNIKMIQNFKCKRGKLQAYSRKFNIESALLGKN